MMMEQDNITNQSKKKNRFFVYLICGAIVVLVVSAVFRLLTPQQIAVQQTATFTRNFDGSTTTFANIQFSGKVPDLPRQASVGITQSSTTTAQQVVDQLTSAYHLKATSQPPTTWVGSDYALNQNKLNNLYYLVRNSAANVPSNQTVQVAQTTQIAQNFLQQNFPKINLQPIQSQMKYYDAGLEPTEIDPSKAKIVSIPFAYVIDGLPVLYQNQGEFPFQILVTADNQIQKVVFYSHFVQISTVGQKNLLSVNQALEHIRRNNAVVVSAVKNSSAPVDFTTITSANFSSVNLEYRIDEQTQVVYPFFHFSGTAVNKNGENFALEVITPAVETATAIQSS
jgi:hypothetical protein